MKGRTIVSSVYFPFRIWKSNQKEFMPKSFTLVYQHSSISTRNRFIQFGDRQIGDRLLYFEAKKVMLSNRFAAADFLYENSQQSITSFAFSLDVNTLSI